MKTRIWLLLTLCLITLHVMAEEGPADARRHMIRGVAAIEIAKSNAELSWAADEFYRATELDPSLSAAWYNLGSVLAKLGQFEAAIESYKRYVTLVPKAEDAQKVQDEIVKLEFRQELLTKSNQTGKVTPDVSSYQWPHGNRSWPNGDTYVGEFSVGQLNGERVYYLNGKGVYQFANGNRYEGEFRDDHIQGNGVFTCSNGKTITGPFSKLQPSGLVMGCYSGHVPAPSTPGASPAPSAVSAPAVQSAPATPAPANLPAGTYQAKRSYGNGDTYVGEFRAGQINGKGVYQFANGNRYEGEFRDNNIQGNGVFTCANGKTIPGPFSKLQPVGLVMGCD